VCTAPEKLKICKSEGPDEDGHREGLNMADRANLGPTQTDLEAVGISGGAPGQNFRISDSRPGRNRGVRKTENLKTWKKSRHFLKNIKLEHNKH